MHASCATTRRTSLIARTIGAGSASSATGYALVHGACDKITSPNLKPTISRWAEILHPFKEQEEQRYKVNWIK